MSTTTTPTKARSKRASVPAPAAPVASPALDALTSSPTPSGAVLVDVAQLRPHPGNPRRDLGDLTELADSIRAHGVRQNLLVVPDPDEPGAYRLVIGHRRTAAARLAGVTALPAVVDAALTPAEQLELMLLENLQRADLTAIEEADAYQGLLDLGMDAAAIAKTTGRSRSTVTARLRLRGLPAAAQEMVHSHQATLDDAARLLDFTGHPDVQAQLVDRLGDRDFAHHAQRYADEIADAERVAEKTAELVAAGVTVVERPAYDDKSTVALHNLTGDPKGAGYNAPRLDDKKHARCPGHVAWVTPNYNNTTSVTYGCNDWKAQGHGDRFGSGGSAASGPMSDDEKAERRELIANNKAAAAAETVRREWLAAYLRLHPKLPPDAPTYAAVVIRPGASADFHEKPIFQSLLYGKDVTDHDIAADLAKPDLAMRYLVALAAARVEAQMPKDFWRKGDGRRDLFAHHLSHLAGWGYPLSDVEQLVVNAAVNGGRP